MKKEKGQKVKFIVYVVVRVLVVLALIRQIWEHDWHDVMLCGMTLILLFLPTLLSKQLALRLPNVLEIIIVVFIFAAEILGEVHGFYVIFPNWDDILHTTNGFLAAAIGIALVDVLNQAESVAGFCGGSLVLLFHDDRRAVGILRMQHGYVLRNRYAEGYMDLRIQFCCHQSGRC